MAENHLTAIISKELSITEWQIANTVKLLDEGATIPFISRYRKEMTGTLDEVAIQNISERYNNLNELVKRKAFITATIEECGKMTPELNKRIIDCWDSNQIEDIYLPYKPKRRTKAEIARNNGLEPLAKIIMAQHDDDINYCAHKYVNDNVNSTEDAIAGAKDIIAEWISENETVRNIVRYQFKKSATIVCKVAKGQEVAGENYKNYFDLSESLKHCSSHRLLAMRRGEKEGFLKVSINIDDEEALLQINRIAVKGKYESCKLVSEAVADGYKRLIRPSIETEFSSIYKEKADSDAIEMFAQNVRQLLFAAPLGHKRIMGVDPGYRTGCKIVCLDEQGNLLHNDNIYPNPPQSDFKTSSRKITQLVEAYKIDAIALGNGTASRETEKFLAALHYDHQIQVYVISENGASIYSASKIARDEFPDKDVTVRGAVSIGRRLLDPLAELVKIDPKSIGVGQYQHDVDQAKLKNALTFTVESCVNSVGVNLNTASKELLTYVAGLGPQLAQNIVTYRAENGDFATRKQVLKVPRMGEKAFQQAAGFLRIPDCKNPLDNSAVHPERYSLVEQMAKDCGSSVAELMANKSLRESINLAKYIKDDVGKPTLDDIMSELEKPGRDPRKGIKVLEFDENVKSIEDVSIGMVLNGIITNITQFGVFVDFGIKENGLVHISELSDKFVTSPTEVVTLHQHVKVRVIDVDKSRKRIALSMKGI
ncbi:MAG: Tex family protein [Muribaculaceae bacterium]